MDPWPDWTWQLPPEGDEQGLEGYRVVDVWGRTVGNVRVLLRRGDEPVLVVRSGSLFNVEHRAVPLEYVAFADHSRWLVGLTISREQLARFPTLSRRLAIRAGPADATRVTAVPPLSSASAAPGRGAAPSPFAPAMFVAAVGLLALLAMILFVTAPWDSWEFSLFSIPGAFFLLALTFVYRGARRPALTRRGPSNRRHACTSGGGSG